MAAVYEEVLKAGAHPILNMSLDGQAATYFKHAGDAQLDWVSPVAEWMVDNVDVRISVGASTNTRELSAVPPERQTRRQAAMGELMGRAMERSAEGSFRWCYTLFPTGAYASEAEMSTEDYEDFYYGACLATDPDPLTAWERASSETRRLAKWIEGREEVHVTAPGTDIRLGIAGRTFIPCVGDHNMPDGEFFTGPIEDSVEGEVSFHLPAVIGGREVSGVRLRFESGKVVEAEAERGEEFLIKLLDTDEGARRLGELGIGTNYGIDRGTLRGAARREDRRHGPHGSRSQLPRVWRSERVGGPHRPGLRPARGREDRRRRRGALGGRQVRGLNKYAARPPLPRGPTLRVNDAVGPRSRVRACGGLRPDEVCLRESRPRTRSESPQIAGDSGCGLSRSRGGGAVIQGERRACGAVIQCGFAA